MNTKLFVGNLGFDVTENELQELFAGFGPVNEVNLIMDRATGRSRGFAFVTMATPEGAQAAISGAAGRNLKGRDLKVSEAREREDRGGPRGRGGGGRGEYGGRPEQGRTDSGGRGGQGGRREGGGQRSRY